MKISIITLFPEVFNPILNTSILKRAQQKGKVAFELINLREFGEGKHKMVDDRPYGGGAGMILRPDILAKAIHKLRSHIVSHSTLRDEPSGSDSKSGNSKIVLTSASGKPYKQRHAQRLSKLDHLIIVCGHYEGVDQRFIDKYVSEEISIGDYVLTGGEIPAMVIMDSVVRLLPGVLEKPEATEEESFSNYHPTLRRPATTYQLLEYPHYTRPEELEGRKVPKVLLSGNHAAIAKWRFKKAQEKTKKIRPDLFYHTSKV